MAIVKLPGVWSFTGTQIGASAPQLVSLDQLILEHQPYLAVHGCCIGADDDFDRECARHAIDRIGVPADHVRSVLESVMRARDGSRFSYQPSGPGRSREEPLVRNRRIVSLGLCLIAMPKAEETTRSGTWATVRLARRAKKRVIVIWPDGRVEEEVR